MSFSLSGSTITQSGTDTDVSGLSGLSGVTVTTTAGRTVYNVGDRKLQVNGTLSQDNRVEEIWFGSSAPTPTVNVTGTYNVGVVVTYDTKESYTVGSPFTFTKTGGKSFKDYDCNIMCRDSGTLNLNGCSIRLSGNRSLWYEIGAHGKIRETHIYSKVIGDTARVYLLSADTDVDGFYCYDLNAVNFNSAMVQLKNYIPYNVRLPFFYNGPKDAGPTLYVENFERFGNWSGDQQGQCAAKYIYQNKVEGADTLLVYCRGRTNDNDFVVELRKDILINTIDNTGAPLGAVKFHSRDVNNGHRIDFWAGTSSTDTVYVTDRTYAFTTDTGGIGVDQDYLSAVVVGNNTPKKYNYLETPMLPMPVDDRGEAGVAKFNGIEYNKLVTTVSVPLKYANKTIITWTLFVDTDITETNKTTVDAYTELETPQKVYDRAKSHLYDNYQGEVQPFILRSGEFLDFGPKSFTIDKTTTSAFAFNGYETTIKADKFSGSVITQDGVYLYHGATLENCTINGDLYVWVESDATLTFNGVIVTGNVVNDDSDHTLTINAGVGTTITTTNPGTGNGQVNITSSATLTVSGLHDNTEVRLYTSDLSTEIGGIENSVGSVNIMIHQAYTDAVLVIHHIEYEPIRLVVDLNLVDTNIPIKQRLDRNYNNPI